MANDWKGKPWTVWVALLVIAAMVLTFGINLFYAILG